MVRIKKKKKTVIFIIRLYTWLVNIFDHFRQEFHVSLFKMYHFWEYLPYNSKTLKIPLKNLLHAYNVVSGASLVAQRVKHLPAMQETWVQSLGQEDPLEKEIATHSSTLTWKNPMDREAW